MLVRRWIKYRDIQTGDQDYEKARRDTIIAAVIWSALVVAWVVIGTIQVLTAITAITAITV